MANMLFRVICGGVPILFTATVHGGSVRHDLPQLQGDYLFDLGSYTDLTRFVTVNTPYVQSSVSDARIIVSGYTTSGTAHGDGIYREATDFGLVPTIYNWVLPGSFEFLIDSSPGPTIGRFDIENDFQNQQIVGEMPPANSFDGPPLSFTVGFSLSADDFSSNYPALIGPPMNVSFARIGIVVDTPIRATITQAYLIIEGPGVVAEPGCAWIVMAMIGLLYARRRPPRRRQ